MVKTAWYDVEMRGRRLEALFKQLNTRVQNMLNDDDINQDKLDMIMSYLDRLIKLEHTTQPYVEQITGLKKFLKVHERKADYISA